MPDNTARATPGLEFEQEILELERKIADLEKFMLTTDMDLEDDLDMLRDRRDRIYREIYTRLNAWQRVQVARHAERPSFETYVEKMFDEFYELHGDRCFGDDVALPTGFARLGDQKMLLIGHRKGRTTQERIKNNFGSAHPEGYRKALQKMRLAEKFNVPIVSLVNTPGAFPGIGAEERGQAMAIAVNIFEMFRVKVPIIVIVIGEGGSGGALGIGVGDRVYAMENSYYSVISPEGCAAILWKSGDKAPAASEALRLTPQDLMKFGIIDDIIPEPAGGAHRNVEGTINIMREWLLRDLKELRAAPIDSLMNNRYERFRRIGRFIENGSLQGYFLEPEIEGGKAREGDTDRITRPADKSGKKGGRSK